MSLICIGETHFHKNNFSRRLVLTQRQTRARKWAIRSLVLWPMVRISSKPWNVFCDFLNFNCAFMKIEKFNFEDNCYDWLCKCRSWGWKIQSWLTELFDLTLHCNLVQRYVSLSKCSRHFAFLSYLKIEHTCFKVENVAWGQLNENFKIVIHKCIYCFRIRKLPVAAIVNYTSKSFCF